MRWLVILPLMAGLFGCVVNKPMELSMTRPTTDESYVHDAPRPPTKPDCGVRIASVTDRRNLGENVGHLGTRYVRSPDAFAWLRDRFLELETPGKDASAQALSLRVELLKLYVHTLPSSKSAIALLRMEVSNATNTLSSKLYRSTETSIHWSGTADEARSALQAVMVRVRDDVATELPALCNKR